MGCQQQDGGNKPSSSPMGTGNPASSQLPMSPVSRRLRSDSSQDNDKPLEDIGNHAASFSIAASFAPAPEQESPSGKKPSRTNEDEVSTESPRAAAHQHKKASASSSPAVATPPASTPTAASPDTSEGDKGGGIGFGYMPSYMRGLGDKSIISRTSSNFVELGLPNNMSQEDPPDETSLLGVTVKGSKKKKKKRQENPRASVASPFEPVDELTASKCSAETSRFAISPTPTTEERNHSHSRTPLDPDGTTLCDPTRYHSELKKDKEDTIVEVEHQQPPACFGTDPSRLDSNRNSCRKPLDPEGTTPFRNPTPRQPERKKDREDKHVEAECQQPPAGFGVDPSGLDWNQNSSRKLLDPKEDTTGGNEIKGTNKNIASAANAVVKRTVTAKPPTTAKGSTSATADAAVEEEGNAESKLDIVLERKNEKSDEEFVAVMDRVKSCLKNNIDKDETDIDSVYRVGQAQQSKQPATPLLSRFVTHERTASPSSSNSGSGTIHELRAKFESSASAASSSTRKSFSKTGFGAVSN